MFLVNPIKSVQFFIFSGYQRYIADLLTSAVHQKQRVIMTAVFSEHPVMTKTTGAGTQAPHHSPFSSSIEPSKKIQPK